MQEPSPAVVSRVRRIVEEAAAQPIASGRALVVVQRLADLVAGSAYDCPVVVLTPTNPEAAGVVVEVQQDELWWVNADDGPGTELHVGMTEDRYAVLGSLIRAVVAGDYRHGPCGDAVRRLFRSPRKFRGWCETFNTGQGPRISRHFGREVPRQERRFPPH